MLTGKERFQVTRENGTEQIITLQELLQDCASLTAFKRFEKMQKALENAISPLQKQVYDLTQKVEELENKNYEMKKKIETTKKPTAPRKKTEAKV